MEPLTSCKSKLSLRLLGCLLIFFSVVIQIRLFRASSQLLEGQQQVDEAFLPMVMAGEKKGSLGNGTEYHAREDSLRLSTQLGGHRQVHTPLAPKIIAEEKNDSVAQSSSYHIDWKDQSDHLTKIFRQAIRDGTSKTLPRAFPQMRDTKNNQPISIATHLGVSKFDRFVYMVRRWGGPVSATIYINNERQITELAKAHYANSNELVSTEIHLHLEGNATLLYPHNTLRQIAVDYLQTEFFLALDADMMTLPNASFALSSLLQTDPNMATDLRTNTVIVVPVFERRKAVVPDDADVVHNADKLLPNDKTELHKLYTRRKIAIFHAKVPSNQGFTDHRRWFRTDTSSRPYYFINYELVYEPYVITCKNAPNLPRYWEGFRGFGYNKASWLTDLYFSGFQFAVLRDSFLVHMEHKTLESKRLPNLEDLYTDFRHYLKEKFSWDDETYQMIFARKGHINGYAPHAPPDNRLPVLVGWREQKGNVFGRLFKRDSDTEPMFFGATLDSVELVDGGLTSNRTVATKSGWSLFLSNGKLLRSDNSKWIP